MTDRSTRDHGASFDALSDDDLLATVRAGDTGAYSALYDRHLGAALTLARRLGGSHDPQDVAQEAFLKILKSILRGGGPEHGFVGYLMRAVRNEVIDRSRRAREIAVEDVETVEPTRSIMVDGMDQRFDHGLMKQAFSALPEKWQQILWLTEVEGLAPRAVAPQLQQSPNAVAQLSRRAREGLRTAWLQAHVDVASAREECRQTAGSLGAYERGQLSAPRAARVEAHLEGCLRCSAALAELREVATRMRGLLLPIVLGSPLLLTTLSDVLAFPGTGVALASVQDGSGPDRSDGTGTAGEPPTDAGATTVPAGAPDRAGAASDAVMKGADAAGRLGRWKVSLAAQGSTLVAAGATAAVVVAGAVFAAQLPNRDPSAAETGPGTAGVHASEERTPGTADPSDQVPASIPTSVREHAEEQAAPTGAGSLGLTGGAGSSPVSVVHTGPEPDPEPVPEPSSEPTDIEVEIGSPESNPAPLPPGAPLPDAGSNEPVQPLPSTAPPEGQPAPEQSPEPVEPGPVDPAPELPGPVNPEPSPEPVDPAPVDPEPVDPEPSPEPVDPAPVDPEPVDPEPSPEPVDPAPVDPEPSPEPVDPAPVDPEPVDPEPSPEPEEPGPVEPEPEVPGPVDPEPSPEPVDPALVEPEPEEPGPVEPGPTDPEPEEPEPSVSAPTIEFPAGGSYALPVTLTGEGVPGALVRIRDQNGQEVASTTVDDEGHWSVSPAPGAPDVATRFRAEQEVEGTTSSSSGPTDEYVFLAPDLLSPSPGSTIPANTLLGSWAAWVVLQVGLSEHQAYSVIIDGEHSDFRARTAGSTASHLALLVRGTHTIELAYRDPDTGRLGAVRTMTLTVV